MHQSQIMNSVFKIKTKLTNKKNKIKGEQSDKTKHAWVLGVTFEAEPFMLFTQETKQTVTLRFKDSGEGRSFQKKKKLLFKNNQAEKRNTTRQETRSATL